MIKVALLHFWFDEYVVALANGLAQLDSVEVMLIHPERVNNLVEQQLDPRVRAISFWQPRRIRDLRNYVTMRTLLRLFRELQPDVVHVQEPNFLWYDLTLLLNQFPPLVTTIHDIFRHPGDKDLTPGAEFTRRIAYRRSQHLVVHTPAIKQGLVDHFNVAAHRISVLPHGELGSLYQRLATTPAPEREPNTLLFFGRIWAYKGLKYLIEAMPLVAEKIPQVKLVIAGRGDDLKEYLPENYDRSRYEVLNGYIPTDTVAGLFQRSAAVVLPYIEASQSGVATIAYGTGTPVIASDVGGLGELVHSEKDGFLVPPADVPALADAIIRLLSDRSLQHQMQRAAFERSQTDLNWVNIAAQTTEVYEKCISQRNERALAF